MLNLSNCISTYYFAERYQWEALFSNTRKFFFLQILPIFYVYATNREAVLRWLVTVSSTCQDLEFDGSL